MHSTLINSYLLLGMFWSSIMKRRLLLVAVICLVVAVLGWMLVQKIRGPALAGYEVVLRPLVDRKSVV